MKVRLADIAHARSGDKGDTANVGIIALRREWYDLIARELTERRVADHFRGVITGAVQRYELPNLLAFNFVLYDVLGGGASRSLRIDSQGKTLALQLLELEVPKPEKT